MHQREKVVGHGLASQAQAVVLFGAGLSHQDSGDLGQSNIYISAAGVYFCFFVWYVNLKAA